MKVIIFWQFWANADFFKTEIFIEFLQYPVKELLVLDFIIFIFISSQSESSLDSWIHLEFKTSILVRYL